MLAKKLNVPIISADAYQVYKELNAGVNKPSEKHYQRLNIISYPIFRFLMNDQLHTLTKEPKKF